MSWVVGSLAYHRHIQNVVLSIMETGLLREWHVGLVDFESPRDCGFLNRLGKKLFPRLRGDLARRRIEAIPASLIRQHPLWEVLRVGSARLGFGKLTSDWIWEREEWAMDGLLKRAAQRDDVSGIFGVEHGCLAAIREANRLGKWSAVAFTSLHHAFVEKWVLPEMEKFPELRDDVSARLDLLARARDRRRDMEAQAAKIIHTNSELTKRTLIEAGFRENNFIKVPLASLLPPLYAASDTRREKLRIVMCGAVSVRKGTHLLMQAWEQGGFSSSASLELYGAVHLPTAFIEKHSSGINIYGMRPRSELEQACRAADAMIFPTLADGFGVVVMEAMGAGCPVLCSANAGAAEMIRHNVNGRIFAPGSVQAIKDEIQWCLDNREKLHEMRYEAYETAKNWTWDNFRKSFRTQFEKIINKRSEDNEKQAE